MALIINKENLQSLYIRWLRAAYIYYWGYGEDTEFSDWEWETLSRYFYSNKHLLNAEEYPVVFDERFSGASLFWLPKNEYPEEALL